MAEKKKTCPSCTNEIPSSATVCPQCKAELEVVVWEVEKVPGKNVSFRGHGAIEAVREALLSGEIKLSNPARQRIEVLERVEE